MNEIAILPVSVTMETLRKESLSDDSLSLYLAELIKEYYKRG